MASAKKAEIVDYLDRLFAAPFATLSPEQREAVETWCPPGMAIPELRKRHRIEVMDTTNPEAGIGEGEDETFDVDPQEAFDPDEEFSAGEEVPETEAA